MDKDIKLLPSSNCKTRMKKSLEDFVFVFKMRLTRLFLQRFRFYLSFLLEFLIFYLFGFVFSYINPFLCNIALNINKQFSLFVFIYVLFLLSVSGITFLGVALSVISNAALSFCVGLIGSWFVITCNFGFLKTFSLMFLLTLFVFLYIIFSAEIFFTSKSILAGKLAVKRPLVNVSYIFTVSVLSSVIYYLSLYFIKLF